jgi:serpin B
MNPFVSRTVVAACASAFVACGGSAPSGAPGSVRQSPLSRDTAPSTRDLSQLVVDNTRFAFELYRELAPGNSGNLFYSPYSISIALAMAYAGAAGQTAQQMSRALHYTLAPARLHYAFDALDLALASRAEDAMGQGLRLQVAGSLWGDVSMTFQSAFLDTLAVDYGAGLQVADFVGAPEPARVAINGWVSDRTSRKIPELLPVRSIDSQTRVVLVNAIYFDAPWAVPFDPKATASAAFTRADGSTTTVDTMSALASNFLGYAEGPTWQAVEIPYAGESTSMVIVLPQPGQFATVEQGLTGDFVNSLRPSSDLNLQVMLPKLTVHRPVMDLTAQLKALGMVDAFAESADFSAMSAAPLKLKAVFHDAFVRVDENGTEAAASTAVVSTLISAPQLSKTVNVNRPFFFFVRDVLTNAVLFIGRIMDPTAPS